MRMWSCTQRHWCVEACPDYSVRDQDGWEWCHAWNEDVIMYTEALVRGGLSRLQWSLYRLTEIRVQSQKREKALVNGRGSGRVQVPLKARRADILCPVCYMCRPQKKGLSSPERSQSGVQEGLCSPTRSPNVNARHAWAIGHKRVSLSDSGFEVLLPTISPCSPDRWQLDPLSESRSPACYQYNNYNCVHTPMWPYKHDCSTRYVMYVVYSILLAQTLLFRRSLRKLAPVALLTYCSPVWPLYSPPMRSWMHCLLDLAYMHASLDKDCTSLVELAPGGSGPAVAKAMNARQDRAMMMQVGEWAHWPGFFHDVSGACMMQGCTTTHARTGP
eukprot:1155607-Pelagomonas_calceolata.AAC.1